MNLSIVERTDRQSINARNGLTLRTDLIVERPNPSSSVYDPLWNTIRTVGRFSVTSRDVNSTLSRVQETGTIVRGTFGNGDRCWWERTLGKSLTDNGSQIHDGDLDHYKRLTCKIQDDDCNQQVLIVDIQVACPSVAQQLLIGEKPTFVDTQILSTALLGDDHGF